jgi:hypothetical protein
MAHKGLIGSLVFVALSALAGCGSFKPFTHETRVAHSLGTSELKNLQFYVSDTITLRRELTSDSRSVSGSHKLLLVSGKTIEEVVIPAKTPGVVVSVEDGALAVSFEPGSSLRFEAAGEAPVTHDPNPFPGFASPPDGPDPFPGHDRDAARVRLERFGGVYFLSLANGGRVTYQGASFEVHTSGKQAHLVIDSESLEKVVKSKKVLPGMRLQ